MNKEFSFTEVVNRAKELEVNEQVEIYANDEYGCQVFGISCIEVLESQVLVIGLCGFPMSMQILSLADDDPNFIDEEAISEYFKKYQQPDSNLSWNEEPYKQ